MDHRGKDTVGWFLLGIAVLLLSVAYAWRSQGAPPERSDATDGGSSAGLDAPPRGHVGERPPGAPAPEPATRAGPPPALHGVVTTDDWFRIPGADVVLTLDAPERERDTVALTGRVVARARTDADGRFAFASVPDGEVFLVVSGATHPEGGDLADAYVTARAGTDEVTIKILGRPGVWFRALDPEGRPVFGAEVALNPPHGTPWRVRSDADGWAQVPLRQPADPAAMRVSIHPPANRTDLDAVYDVPFEERTVLPGGPGVAGEVQDAEGRPVSGARVHARNVAWPEGKVVQGVSREDGRFVLGRLGEGAVQIWAMPPEGSAFTEDWEHVATEVGATKVRLVLPPVADLTVLVEGVEGPVFLALRQQIEGTAPLPPVSRLVPIPEIPGLSAEVPGSVPLDVRMSDDWGRVVFPALPSRRPYVLWMLPDGEGRTFLRADVRAGGPEVRVVAARGLPTHVRLDRPTLAWIRDAWALDEHGAVFDLERSGEAQRFPALPPGRWHVVAVVEHNGTVRNGNVRVRETLEADVLAGEDLLLVPTAR
ncbi:MAG TPA: carboxypeptidase-like regulatory domain-containing protein [Planctomycetota bacterium]|nr:carboxypeptidase-like regulatory domain-containing protein [Planctomycetota bacterium]